MIFSYKLQRNMDCLSTCNSAKGNLFSHFHSCKKLFIYKILQIRYLYVYNLIKEITTTLISLRKLTGLSTNTNLYLQFLTLNSILSLNFKSIIKLISTILTILTKFKFIDSGYNLSLKNYLKLISFLNKNHVIFHRCKLQLRIKLI